MAWSGIITATTLGTEGASFGFNARGFLLTHTSTAGCYLDITTTSGASTGTAFLVAPATSVGQTVQFGPVNLRGAIGFSVMCPQTSVGAVQSVRYAAWR
jgi:hypothetical protein